MALDQVEQRHDGEGPVADLVGQRRQRKVYPLALEACTLAVERDTQGGGGLKLRTLAKLNLERQIGSESATWLDRELISRERLMITDGGFGREVKEAPHRRAMRLVEMGYPIFASRTTNCCLRACRSRIARKRFSKSGIAPGCSATA